MNRRIWKYTLALKALQKVAMPLGARQQLLSVQRQGEDIVLWAIVDADEPRIDRVTVLIVGTGREMPDRCTLQSYVGTVETVDGFVAHVFVVEPHTTDS